VSKKLKVTRENFISSRKTIVDAAMRNAHWGLEGQLKYAYNLAFALGAQCAGDDRLANFIREGSEDFKVLHG
jgi:hypothetical protein